jgi:hypothetical protein
LDQVLFILTQAIDRDLLTKSQLLLKKGNIVTLVRGHSRVHVFNSSANLAEPGSGENFLTDQTAKSFLDIIHEGVGIPVNGYATVEEARSVLSRFHVVTEDVLPEQFQPAASLSPTAGSKMALAYPYRNLVFRCTCMTFCLNCVYCAHILRVCHEKKIIDIDREMQVIQAVPKPGRPPKRRQCLDKRGSGGVVESSSLPPKKKKMSFYV